MTLRHSELHAQLLMAEAQYTELAGLVADRTHETVAQRLRRAGEQLAERVPCGQLCLLRLDALAGTLQTRILTLTLTLIRTLAVPFTLIVPSPNPNPNPNQARCRPPLPQTSTSTAAVRPWDPNINP